MDTREWAKALEALGKPLAFARGRNFQNLERVVDLEATLVALARRAQGFAETEKQRQALQVFLENLATPPTDHQERIDALNRCARVLEELEATAVNRGERGQPPAVDKTPPAPGAADAQKKGALTRAPRAPGGGVRPVPLRELAKGEGTLSEELRSETESLHRRPGTKRPPATDRETSQGVRRAATPGPKVGSRRLTLQTEVTYMKGVGPWFAEKLATRGLTRVEDLLRYLPRRYEDRRTHQRIGELMEGTVASVVGVVLSKSMRQHGRRRTLEVLLTDDSGALVLTWFRVPGKGFADRFTQGARYRVSGTVKRYRSKLQMVHPETQHLDSEGDMDDDLPEDVHEDEGPERTWTPVYLDVEGLRPPQLRKIIAQALELCTDVEEPLPEAMLARHQLPSLGESILALHQPPPTTPLEELLTMDTPWHRRLIFEELFLLQLAVLRRKGRGEALPAVEVPTATPLPDLGTELFPFPLTGAQRRVLQTLQDDLQRGTPMNRLLQGDVGSGKTAVAMTLAAGLAKAGLQTAIMAPTELLAEQHARNALKVLTKVGIRFALLTGSTPQSERRRTLAGLRHGEIAVVIGTHALIQDDIEFASLALGIVDEQHRFGVMQRGRFVELGRRATGKHPHMLVMTATPIPRTLALTLYGDLELAVLDELPPGRMPIETKVFRERQRAEVYQRLRQEVHRGRQAYVVFPLVEESEAEGMEGIRDATSAAEELANGPLQGIRVGLLHGRMEPQEKERVMRAFSQGEIKVLVSTTVIEVGIDVPNATVMVVEHAERFGLSQLHQLRGRVGRGTHASYCFLLAASRQSEDSGRRLEVMEQSQDGFVIAERDLEIRGPGDFVGTRQSGLPLFQVADLQRDHELLQKARAEAMAVLADDPHLEHPSHRGIRHLLESQWHGRLELSRIG